MQVPRKLVQYEDGFECELENPTEEILGSSPNPRTNGEITITEEEKRQIFDAVYDDIYEVVLPNTLWGIHRDPEERRYIAFTLFDVNDMKCSIAVKITVNFNLKIIVNGDQHTDTTLDELSVDTLTKLLNQLNESPDRLIC